MADIIASVDDHGSVVVVRLDAEGEQRIIPMDRRAFGWMVEGEGVENVDDLIGRPVRFDGETLLFLDALEIA